MDLDYQGQIELLYSSKGGPSGNMSSILFMERIHKMFEKRYPQRRHHFTVFRTDPSMLLPKHFLIERRSKNVLQRSRDMLYVGEHHNVEYRRFTGEDLQTALGPIAEREKVVAYVCGPPRMTDWAVDVLRSSTGMDEKRVLCEKWW